MIKFESEILDWLNLPSIPKKKWDGKTSFKVGVAVIELQYGAQAYAVATFDSDSDSEPRVKKVFSLEQFVKVSEIFVVPSYMDEDIEHMDLDEQSKQAAQRLLDEAHELENEGIEEKIEMPKNEYFFDTIHNDEEAMAFIKSYNKANRIKGRVPRDHETIVMKLSVLWSNLQNKNNKKKNRK
jgi:hypothetical protein